MLARGVCVLVFQGSWACEDMRERERERDSQRKFVLCQLKFLWVLNLICPSLTIYEET